MGRFETRYVISDSATQILMPSNKTAKLLQRKQIAEIVPLLEETITLCIVRGTVMSNCDADTLSELKRLLRSRVQQQHGERGRPPSNQSMTPAIKMVVGDWYVDELGLWTREIKARD